MINEPKTVGQRIKHAREKAGLTQSDLAKLLGYGSPTAVSLIEADERQVKVETLGKIADVLHQDLQYLTTGKRDSLPTFRTALRADNEFDSTDVQQIENYIDFLISQKSKKDGRG